jgi:oligoribonuclease NrnB/cAMP/cGMP phosphodiesterase (DHH superfamily)
MDTVLAYFSENLDKISKKELLQALKDALESANCWREACLGGATPKP